MYPILNDLNETVNYTKEALQIETYHAIKFAIEDKEYPLEDLTQVFLIQDITGKFTETEFSENDFPKAAFDVVENVLEQYQSNPSLKLFEFVDGLNEVMAEEEMENFLKKSNAGVIEAEKAITRETVTKIAIEILGYKQHNDFFGVFTVE